MVSDTDFTTPYHTPPRPRATLQSWPDPTSVTKSSFQNASPYRPHADFVPQHRGTWTSIYQVGPTTPVLKLGYHDPEPVSPQPRQEFSSLWRIQKTINASSINDIPALTFYILNRSITAMSTQNVSQTRESYSPTMGITDIPSRSTSLSKKRKPVPGLLLPMPTSTLPPSHPFARTTNGDGGADSPMSPTLASIEQDLFFSPVNKASPGRGGPVPPRREVAKVGSPASSIRSASNEKELALKQREEELRLKEAALREREERLARLEAASAPMSTMSTTSDLEERLARLEAALSRATINGHQTPAQLSPAITQGTSVTAVSLPPIKQRSPLRPISAKFEPAPEVPQLERPLPQLPDTSMASLPRVSSSDSIRLRTPTTPYYSQFQGHDAVPMGKEGSGESSGTHERWNSHAAPRPPASVVSDTSKTSKRYKEAFSVDGLPPRDNLLEAATCFVKDEDGNSVCFGDFFPKNAAELDTASTTGSVSTHSPTIRKTVVFFLRNMFCGQCADYSVASLAILDPKAIEAAGIRIIVMGPGGYEYLKKYREIYKCPFPMYSDNKRNVYKLLGMTKYTNDFGPMRDRAEYHQSGVPMQLVRGIGNALIHFPLSKPGKITQLGGEFILEGGVTCSFAHRMTNTSNHMEAPVVLRLAGVPHPTIAEMKAFEIQESQKAELEKLEAETLDWREERRAELERIRRRKAERRGQVYVPAAVHPSAVDLSAYLSESPRTANVEKVDPVEGSQTPELVHEQEGLGSAYATPEARYSRSSRTSVST